MKLSRNSQNLVNRIFKFLMKYCCFLRNLGFSPFKKIEYLQDHEKDFG